MYTVRMQPPEQVLIGPEEAALSCSHSIVSECDFTVAGCHFVYSFYDTTATCHCAGMIRSPVNAERWRVQPVTQPPATSLKSRLAREAETPKGPCAFGPKVAIGLTTLRPTYTI